MIADEVADAISIDGAGYSLRISREEPAAELDLSGRQIASLQLASGLDAMDVVDERSVLGPPSVHREPGALVVRWQGSSARWGRKEVELRAWDGGFSYGYTVAGRGAIDRAHLLRTRATTSPAYSVRMFTPEPNSGMAHYTGDRCSPGKRCYMCFPDQFAEESRYAGPDDFMTISVGSSKTYHDGHWFFTPPPFCYAVEGRGNWLALGIAAETGEWSFSEMQYPGGGFGFSLVYDGHARVDGIWRSPRLVCLTARDEYDAVQRYCDTLREWGLAPSHGRGPIRDWWREPIFCGWGEQVSQEVHAGSPGLAADRCTQENYERWLRTLEAHGVHPGTVVIDDKWQRSYGFNDVDAAKWPDMPGFIAGQHRRGRHVLLWLKAWSAQGLPPEECILDAGGAPLGADPGNPTYRERLAEQVRYMLQDLDADGFKIDFTHTIPVGPEGRSVGGRWGLELMRQWLEIISESAKAAKPDAMVMAHTANPYLADLVDVLRLNDVAGLEELQGSIVPDMRHRARIARAASPYWLLDSDNWPCCSRAQWREYVIAQASGEFGVPSLYYAERLGWGSTDEALQDEDYEAIRAAWAAYRERLSEGRVAVISRR